MRYRIRYLFLLLAIPLQLAAVDYMVSIATNTCGNVQTYTIPEGEQMVLYGIRWQDTLLLSGQMATRIILAS